MTAFGIYQLHLATALSAVTEVLAWFCAVCPGDSWNTSYVPWILSTLRITSGRD